MLAPLAGVVRRVGIVRRSATGTSPALAAMLAVAERCAGPAARRPGPARALGRRASSAVVVGRLDVRRAAAAAGRRPRRTAAGRAFRLEPGLERSPPARATGAGAGELPDRRGARAPAAGCAAAARSALAPWSRRRGGGALGAAARPAAVRWCGRLRRGRRPRAGGARGRQSGRRLGPHWAWARGSALLEPRCCPGALLALVDEHEAAHKPPGRAAACTRARWES